MNLQDLRDSSMMRERLAWELSTQPRTASIPHIVTAAASPHGGLSISDSDRWRESWQEWKLPRRAVECRGSYGDLIETVDFLKDSRHYYFKLESSSTLAAFQTPNARTAHENWVSISITWFCNEFHMSLFYFYFQYKLK